MSRWISFFVLVAVIVIISAFFLRVMAEFLVPLFVACILVVLFRPVHLWILSKMPTRPTLAAILTTTAMVLAVVLPTGFLTVFAAAEGNEMVRRFDVAMINRKVQDVRKSFDLEIPRSQELTELETKLSDFRNKLFQLTKESSNSQSGLISEARLIVVKKDFNQIIKDAQSIGPFLGVKWPERNVESIDSSSQEKESAKDALEDGEKTQKADSNVAPVSDEPELESQQHQPPKGDSPKEDAWYQFAFQMQLTQEILNKDVWEDDEFSEEYLELEGTLNEAAAGCVATFRDFKVVLLGGSTLTLVKELVNPKQEELDKYTKSGVEYLTSALLTIGGTATVFVGRLVVGGMIVVIAFYFFLVDGPGMMQTLMQLSPMDDRHEQELIDEFERVSRAVVLATLAAAVAQGLLAGIGFYFAGVPSVFLLTLLTMVLAMIPFVGAAAVWVPVCIYLFLFENQIVTASVLAVYSMLIVSSADNVIKPFILHGQSNLHPLLALLSVLGGVTALGAIGILIGPMLVVFLQTLLGILRDELVVWDRHAAESQGGLMPAMAGNGTPPNSGNQASLSHTEVTATSTSGQSESSSQTNDESTGADEASAGRDNVDGNSQKEPRQNQNVRQQGSSKNRSKKRGTRKK